MNNLIETITSLRPFARGAIALALYCSGKVLGGPHAAFSEAETWLKEFRVWNGKSL